LTNYELLEKQAREMIIADRRYVPALSNLSAALMDTLPDLNWAGFYLLREGRLVVGPFQGKPACVHIPVGKGVCGTALADDRVMNIPDVHKFPGHIACDSASNSEIVVPLRRADGSVFGVLDIDSPLLGRFTEDDRAGLEEFAAILSEELRAYYS